MSFMVNACLDIGVLLGVIFFTESFLSLLLLGTIKTMALKK